MKILPIKNKGKFIVIIIILGFLSYYFYQQLRNTPGHSPCLADNEWVDYKIEERMNSSSNATVFIKEKNTNKQIFEFQIENIVPNHYHPYEAYKCGIYLVREFNYDYQKGKPLSDFRMEVWRYHYDGNGKKLVEEDDFRIDPSETYLVLKQGYLGSSDYALVIKDLETKEDVFVLSLKDITNQYPSLIGNLDLIEWTKDGQYFWGRVFSGAYTFAFFRINTKNWQVEIFKVPEGVLGGSALNIEKGYITRHPGQIWIGIQEDYEQIKQEWRSQGKTSKLYLRNLFTGKETFLAETKEPLWFFNPKWISDIELEYELPTGEKKIYKIE